jgi:voltage-gated potassium channel
VNYQSSNNRNSGFLYELFTESGTPIRLIWQVIQGTAIVASCLSMLLEHFESYQTGFPNFIVGLELITIGLLTVDYLGNFYFAEDRPAYFFGFWGLVDLISILPFFLLMLNPTSAVVVKSLRMLRFLRLLRLWRVARGGF